MEPITIGLLVAGAMLLKDAKPKVPSFNSIMVQSLAGSTISVHGKPYVITANDGRLMSYLMEGWAGSELTFDEQIMLFAIAFNETLMQPHAVGHVDKKWGSSYTVFQLRRDVELKGAMDAIGIKDINYVVPTKEVQGTLLQPYMIYQAKAALWLARQKKIVSIRNWSKGNTDLEFVQLAAKWGGCGGGTWGGILESPIAGPILNGRIPSNSEIPEINARLLEAAKKAGQNSSCTIGLLNRLVTYRNLRGLLVA